MSNSPSEQYKMFRNFMCNELGITRDDIQRWTKEATAVEVGKQLEAINIPAVVEREVKNFIQKSLGDAYSSYGSTLRNEVALKIATKILGELKLVVKE